jgi:ADP-ribose pyrophosphatase YjhB (NUDIX family)
LLALDHFFERDPNMHGLIIGAEPIEQILLGRKPWEIRGKNTNIRGTIALIKKGSKTVVGTAELVDVHGPLTRAELRRQKNKHRPTAHELKHGCGYKTHYAWELRNVRRLEKPVPYKHPSGAVTWVRMSKAVAGKLVGRSWKWCPVCREQLAKHEIEGVQLLACTSCDYIHYDNPIPVVATLIPVDDGIVLVKRGVAPFIGEWCLPCGFVNSVETPKSAARRESEQECGLKVRLVGIANACLPQVPGVRLNHLVLIYIGQPVGGELQAGDDAVEARVFKRDELPKICFPSHQMAVDDWFNGTLGTLDNPRQTVDRKAALARR